jgi:hypothetical protein
MITVNINITLSKIMAFLVLFIGSFYAFWFKDATVMISTFAAASSIIAVKTFVAGKTKQKEIQYPSQDGPEI